MWTLVLMIYVMDVVAAGSGIGTVPGFTTRETCAAAGATAVREAKATEVKPRYAGFVCIEAR